MLPEGRSIQKSRDLLKGAIDIHIHAGPHLTTSPRSVTPVEAANQARDAGMRAIVYMDVFQMSNGTAQIVNEVVSDLITYGGINLNTVFGGINPRAVRTSLTYAGGAKYVAFGTRARAWLPLLKDCASSLRYFLTWASPRTDQDSCAEKPRRVAGAIGGAGPESSLGSSCSSA